MKSGMSCFNCTVFWKNITSTMPLHVIYAIALVLLYPLGFCRTWAVVSSYDRYVVDASLIEITAIGGVFFTGSLAFAAAFYCFRYLNKTVSCYMLHAMPVSRKSLYVSNLLSGLAMGVVPFAVLYLFVLSMPVSAAAGWGSFALYLLLYLFFYGLAVLSMIVTANGLAAAALYAFLNVGIVVLELLASFLIAPMLFGIRYDAPHTVILCPAIYILKNISSGADAAEILLRLLSSYLWVIGVVGVAAMAGSYWLYRLRHAESAGEIVAHRAMRPVFRYLVTGTASLGLGLFFCFLLTEDADITKTPAVMLGCLLFAAFLGFFGAEMLLQKKLRVFTGRAAAGFAAFCGLLLLCIGLLWFDVFGICTKVPAADRVKQVEVEYDYGSLNFVLQEEQDIREITALHQGIVSDHELLGSDADGWGGNGFTLTYHLTDGTTLTRSYSGKYYSEALIRLRGLLQNRKIQLNFLADSFLQADRITLDYTVATWNEYGAEDYYWTNSTLTAASKDALLAALSEDVAAGRFDVITAQTDYDYIGTLYFYNGRRGYASLNLSKGATSTIAAMEALGLNLYIEEETSN